MENIETGIMLMVVGMATVFTILLVVIFMGKYLILGVNKWAPPEVIKPKVAENAVAPDAVTLQVIQEAVKRVTAGSGQVVKIEKI
ncbi:MAG: OadG family protein [Phocaeicola sp.]